MEEYIYNLFLITENQLISKLGAIQHTFDGSDEDKIRFLNERVEQDSQEYKSFPVPDNYQIIIDDELVKGAITPERYNQLSMIGKQTEIFDGVFEYYGASCSPLCSINHIVDRKVVIKGQAEIITNTESYSKIVFPIVANPYDKYISKDGTFKVVELIEDDFFKPVDILLEQGFLIPATKLLLSAIDSFAFLQFGDEKGNFRKWVDSFMDLQKLYITSEELWELRNSLVHMTNYDSRKNIRGDVARLIIYGGTDSSYYANRNDKEKILHFHSLNNSTQEGVIAWLSAIMNDEDLISLFLERYALIASDFRTDEMIFYK